MRATMLLWVCVCSTSAALVPFELFGMLRRKSPLGSSGSDMRLPMRSTPAVTLYTRLYDWLDEQEAKLEKATQQARVEEQQARVKAQQARVKAQQAGVELQQARVEAQQARVQLQQAREERKAAFDDLWESIRVNIFGCRDPRHKANQAEQDRLKEKELKDQRDLAIVQLFLENPNACTAADSEKAKKWLGNRLHAAVVAQAESPPRNPERQPDHEASEQLSDQRGLLLRMYLQEQTFALEGVGRLEQLSSAERRDEVEAAQLAFERLDDEYYGFKRSKPPTEGEIQAHRLLWMRRGLAFELWLDMREKWLELEGDEEELRALRDRRARKLKTYGPRLDTRARLEMAFLNESSS